LSDPRHADGTLDPKTTAWLDALVARHTAALSPPQFFKAIRALSARYVESRGQLPDRSPTDSAGKRAAFAGFYAPLHFLTMREIVRALTADVPALKQIETIVDLGCGTGAASAAWALECERPSSIHGIDNDTWPLGEASWNWRQLNVRGSGRRGNLVDAAHHLLERPDRASGRRSLEGTAVLLAWSVNELSEAQRDRLFGALTRLAEQRALILVIEPIARGITPWWPQWVEAAAITAPASRAQDWKFASALPPVLAQISDATGFKDRALSARSLLIRH